MNTFLHLVIIAAACAGFFVARHIHRTKRAAEKLVCPIGFDCDKVVHSAYATLWGIHLEVFGMLYYALVALGYATFLVAPAARLPFFSPIALAATAGGLLFSLYLTGVQAFKLRNWCTWCLASAGICAIIFAAVFALAGFL